MKERISATIDPSTSKSLERIMKEGRYRNKSHAIEEALKFFEEKKGYEQ
ncbi:MAG: ribbon-helix-helix domain-containing protein [Nanoarchaeota archaeon]